MSTALCAKSIRKEFPTRSGSLQVLKDVSLTLDAGESAVITGPSGSGKSTLLNILGTLDTPTTGSISIDGCNPFELPEPALARFRNQRIGLIFQDQHLFPQCSAIENVLLPTLAIGRARRSTQVRSAGKGMSARAEARGPGTATDRARSLLERVGLADRLDHRPAELSGGERQRVALARALINHPALLLADEPTGNLDRETASRIASLLCEIHQDENVTLVVVTHSEELAGRFARRFEVVDGRLVSVEEDV